LSNPLVYIFLRICLMLEATGLCQGAWVLAALHKSIAGFKRDEVYIGTAEERRAKKMGDDTGRVRTGAGHPLKLPIIPAMDGIENLSLTEIVALENDLAAHMADVKQKLVGVKRQKRDMEDGKVTVGQNYYPVGSYGAAQPNSLKALAEADPDVMAYMDSIREKDEELGEA
jgi:hypothetical protein